MAWVFQGVINVGVQVLLLIILGYLFAKYKLIDDSRYTPQMNVMILKLAMPAFNLYLIGIKMELRDLDTWRALSAFLLWVILVQVAIAIWEWRFNAGDVGDAGFLNLMLVANNFGMVGMPVLDATFGEPVRSIALLVGVGFFLLIMPYTLVCFEWEKWVMQNHQLSAQDGSQHLAICPPEKYSRGQLAAKGGPLGSSLVGTLTQHALAAATEDRRHAGTGLRKRTRRRLATAKSGHSTLRKWHPHQKSAADLHQNSLKQKPMVLLSLAPEKDAVSNDATKTTDCSAVARDQAADSEAGDSTHDASLLGRSPDHTHAQASEFRPSSITLQADSTPASASPSTSPKNVGRSSMERHAAGSNAASSTCPLPTSPGCNTASPATHFTALGHAGIAPESSIRTRTIPKCYSEANITSERTSTDAHDGVPGIPSARPDIPDDTVSRNPATTAHSLHSADSRQGAARSSDHSHHELHHSAASVLTHMAEEIAMESLSSITHRLHGGSQPTRPPGLPPPPTGNRHVPLTPATPFGQLPGTRHGHLGRGSFPVAKTYGSSPCLNRMDGVMPSTDASPDGIQTPCARPLQRFDRGAASGAAGDSSATVTPQQGPDHVAIMVGRTPKADLPLPSSTRKSTSAWGSCMALESAAGATGGNMASGISVSTVQQQEQQPDSASAAGRDASTAADEGPGEGSTEVPGTVSRHSSYSSTSSKASGGYEEDLFFGDIAASLATGQWYSSGLPSDMAEQVRAAVLAHPLYYYDHQAAERAVTAQLRHAFKQELATRETGRVTAAQQQIFGSPPKSRPTRTSGSAFSPLMAFTPCSVQPTTTITTPTCKHTRTNDIDADKYADYIRGNTPADQMLRQQATARVLETHGGLLSATAVFFRTHPQLQHMLKVLLLNPLLLSQLAALAMSLSGLRSFLDPMSPHFVMELGFLPALLQWLSSITIPLALFGNGVWMYGKKLFAGGTAVVRKIVAIAVLKFLVLPVLMAMCVRVCSLNANYSMALVLLTLSPCSTTSFVLAVQYNHGTEVVTVIMVLGTLLMTPLLVAYLKIFQAAGIFGYTLMAEQ